MFACDSDWDNDCDKQVVCFLWSKLTYDEYWRLKDISKRDCRLTPSELVMRSVLSRVGNVGSLLYSWYCRLQWNMHNEGPETHVIVLEVCCPHRNSS